jgi:hypothetical protein
VSINRLEGTPGRWHLVAAALLARDHAAVPFNRGGFRATILSWADADATRTDANCGVGLVPTTMVPIVIAVVAVSTDLNIDALCHLDAFSLRRSGDEWRSHQHGCDCGRGNGDLNYLHSPRLGLDWEMPTSKNPDGSPGQLSPLRKLLTLSRRVTRPKPGRPYRDVLRNLGLPSHPSNGRADRNPELLACLIARVPRPKPVLPPQSSPTLLPPPKRESLFAPHLSSFIDSIDPSPTLVVVPPDACKSRKMEMCYKSK